LSSPPRVENLWATIGEDDVRRLDIPVDDPGLMGGGEAISEPDADIHDQRNLQSAPRHALLQCFTVQQFHHQKNIGVAGLTDVVPAGNAIRCVEVIDEKEATVLARARPLRI
jgi:hypothetical protein